MIAANAVNAWWANHPWANEDQVEQDLLMTRVAIEISSLNVCRERQDGFENRAEI